MKDARIYFDSETGKGDLYYRKQHICRIKFGAKITKALANNIKYHQEMKQCVEKILS